MDKKKHDLVVIGSGPGGYVAAVRAAQLGMDVACVERHERLGGTCLNVGCIPSKALLEASERYHEAVSGGLGDFGVLVDGAGLDLAAMMKRKETIVGNLTKGVAFLFKKNKITRYTGAARLVGGGVVSVEGADSAQLEADRILIASGSYAATIPGVELDGLAVCSSTQALSWGDVPGHLVVIGAGVIGLELGSVWRRLGADVTVLEYVDRVLPEMDSEISKNALRLLKRQGIRFHLGARVTATKVESGRAYVEVDGMESIEADRVLVATGRSPRTAGLGLEETGVELTGKGRIRVNENFETSVRGVYAIGDVIGGAMLAHKASEEGVACVERMAGLPGHMDHGVIPSVVYTAPEIASVGRTQRSLEGEGVPFVVGSFSFKANGRAMAHGMNDGVVKVLAHETSNEILGVHMIGPWVSEIIGQAAVAMQRKMTAAQLAGVCTAHPSLSEALKEAALAAGGKAIHA